jgi:magnesium transporter
MIKFIKGGGIIMTIENNYINTIITILETHDDFHEINSLLDDYHHYEIAKVVMQIDDDLREKLYQSLSIISLTEVIEDLDPDDAFILFEKMKLPLLINIFDHIETDDLVDIIDSIEDKEKQVLYLSMIPSSKRKVIKSFLHFDDDMVGSIMNNNFASIHYKMTVKNAIKALVDIAPDVEYIHNIYVVDDYQRLVGTLSLKELIHEGHKKNQHIHEIMTENLIYLYPTTPVEEAVDMMKNYDFQLLPIINTDHYLIGVVSFDDVLDVISEESSADYASLAGLTDVEIADDENVWSSLKKRIPWLFILVFVNLITSQIIIGYESQLQALTTLAIFMPMILSMAGNSSTQGLGVVIRLFATQQLKSKKVIFRHLLKELFTGLINGFFIGLGLFLIVLLLNIIQDNPLNEALSLAFVIGLSIQLALTVATLIGSLVPMLLNWLKIDPATASGPFITTVNDILSLLIYFSLATALIAGLS